MLFAGRERQRLACLGADIMGEHASVVGSLTEERNDVLVRRLTVKCQEKCFNVCESRSFQDLLLYQNA